MSFVDLMADHDWSETDVVNRMQALIRATYPQAEEENLNRKITGSDKGFYVLSADEEAEIADYAAVCTMAQTEGRAARADMTLLRAAWAVENGTDTAPADDVAALVALRATRFPLEVLPTDPAP